MEGIINMTNSEKIDLLLAEMQGMKSDMQSMKSDMRGMKSDMQDMKFNLQNMNNKIDTLESQIKQTERVLRNEIKKEFGLVLDEIERVHSILDKHKADASMHCITAF
jgi:chromosome segregation ATPase